MQTVITHFHFRSQENLTDRTLVEVIFGCPDPIQCSIVERLSCQNNLISILLSKIDFRFMDRNFSLKFMLESWKICTTGNRTHDVWTIGPWWLTEDELWKYAWSFDPRTRLKILETRFRYRGRFASRKYFSYLLPYRSCTEVKHKHSVIEYETDWKSGQMSQKNNQNLRIISIFPRKPNIKQTYKFSFHFKQSTLVLTRWEYI